MRSSSRVATDVLLLALAGAALLAPSLAGLPPALIVTAQFDPLRDEGEAYAVRLREAGVDASVKRYDRAIHGLIGSPAAMEDSGVLISRHLREAFGHRPQNWKKAEASKSQ